MATRAIKNLIDIVAPLSKGWNVLTNPNQIILYTGSKTHTDWSVGSSVTFQDEHQGARYENKGK